MEILDDTIKYARTIATNQLLNVHFDGKRCPVCGLHPNQCLGHRMKIPTGFHFIYPNFIEQMMKMLEKICFSYDQDGNMIGCCKNPCVCNLGYSSKWSTESSPNIPAAVVLKYETSNKITYAVNLSVFRAYLKSKNVHFYRMIYCSHFLIPMFLLPERFGASRTGEDENATLVNYRKLIANYEKLQSLGVHSTACLATMPSNSDAIKTAMASIRIIAEFSNMSKQTNNEIDTFGSLSTKTGDIRGRMISTRTTGAGRAVTGTTVLAPLCRIIISPIFAKTITTINVCKYNLSFVKSLGEAGLLLWVCSDGRHIREFRKGKISIGDKVWRCILPGESMVICRNPTLGRDSIIPVVADIPLLSSNPEFSTVKYGCSLTSPLAGDHDGDEVGIYPINTTDGRVETFLKYSIISHYMRDNVPVFTLHFHELTGLYYASKTWSDPSCAWAVPTKMLESFFYHIGPLYDFRARFDEVNRLYFKLGPNCAPSMQMIISAILPRGLSYTHGSFNIRKGLVIGGLLTSKILGRTKDGLFATICHVYGAREALRVVDSLTILNHLYVGYKLSTITWRDFGCHLKTKEINEDIYAQTLQIVTLSRKLAETNSPGLTASIEREIKIVISQIEKIAQRVYNGHEGDLRSMIDSGGRGKNSDLYAMGVQVGQRFMTDGSRTDASSLATVRTNSLDDELVMRGFIKSSYCEGLSPNEMFVDCMAARNSVIYSKMDIGITGSAARATYSGLGQFSSEYGTGYNGVSIVRLNCVNPNIYVHTKYGQSIIDVEATLAALLTDPDFS